MNGILDTPRAKTQLRQAARRELIATMQDLWLGHRLIAGSTGSGKTNLTLCEALEVIRANRHWVTFVAPHPQAAIDLVTELYRRFGESIFLRLVVEQLGDTDRVIMRNLIQKSVHEDPWQRRMENDAFAYNILSLLAARRKEEDFYEKPTLEEISLLTIKLYQNIDAWIPEYLIPEFLNPKSPISQYALSQCKDEELRAAFEAKIHVAPAVAETSTKPVARMFTHLLNNAAMRARTCKRGRWNKRFFHNANGIFIIVGNGCSMDALRTYVFAEFQQICHWAKIGAIGPGLFIADEALNCGFIGDFESKAISTLRGFFVSVWYLTQHFQFPTDGIRTAILNSTSQFLFRQANYEDAKLAASNLLPLLNEYSIHHFTPKQRHAYFLLLKKHGFSVTKTKDGDRVSENVGEQLLPRYVNYYEPVYRSLNDQLLLLAKSIEQLKVGHYFFSSQHSGYGYGQSPRFPYSFTPDDQMEVYRACIRKIKTSPIFDEPTLSQFQPPTDGQAQTHMRKGGKKS